MDEEGIINSFVFLVFCCHLLETCKGNVLVQQSLFGIVLPFLMYLLAFTIPSSMREERKNRSNQECNIFQLINLCELLFTITQIKVVVSAYQFH